MIGCTSQERLIVGETINADLSRSELDALRKLSTQGRLVAVAPGTIDVVAGKTGKVGLLVTNKLINPTSEDTREFSIDVKASDEDNPEAIINTAPNPDPNKWNVNYLDTLSMAQNAQQETVILLIPGKNVASGTYTFIVDVTYTNNNNEETTYDKKRFFTVHVE